MIRFLLLSLLLVSPALATTEISRPFEQAAAAYEQRDFEQASALYRELLHAGHHSPELWFNLGNVSYRQNKLGEAILHYRRAWTLAPRDGDIEANLRFALQAAGHTPPSLNRLQTILHHYTLREWTHLMIAAYWLAAALGIAALLIPSQRRILARLAVLSLLVSLLGLAGRSGWQSWAAHREAIVTAPDTRALFAPYPEATPAFTLPVGTFLHILEENNDWLRVRSGPDSGWIPRSAAPQVYPWK